MENLPFETEPYSTAILSWPSKGRHILASCLQRDENNKSIIVYQAFNSKIATWVVKNQTFRNCPGFSTERMTWIKPNFLWMMYRSGWSTKPNQERILAIAIKEEGFLQLLKLTKRFESDANLVETKDPQGGLDDIGFGVDDVRIQWDPDHDPSGGKVERRAIQLGIRGHALNVYVDKWIDSITDITDFVQAQHKFVTSDKLDLLEVPIQEVYHVQNEALRKHLKLDIANF